jgi:hypothetical protein
MRLHRKTWPRLWCFNAQLDRNLRDKNVPNVKTSKIRAVMICERFTASAFIHKSREIFCLFRFWLILTTARVMEKLQACSIIWSIVLFSFDSKCKFVEHYMYLHWTPTFEISFSSTVEVQTPAALIKYCRILPTLDLMCVWDLLFR